MPTKRDLSKEDWGPNYRGCLVFRSGTGYNWGGRYYPSQELLDKAIDEAGNAIAESITVVNNGSISVTNTE